MEAAQTLLVEQVEAIQSGEDWKRYLHFQAQLHRYSSRNVTLIYAQHAQAYQEGRVSDPEPGYVAGYNTWKALGRCVDKGQHGYAVLAPLRYERRSALDTDGRARALRAGETAQPGETVERSQVLAGFRIEHVFALGQTSGAPVPQPRQPELLEGEAPSGLGAAVLRLMEERGYRVDTVPDAASIGGANGRIDWAARTILVRCDMDDAAMVKTLIHEAGHALLHADGPGRALPRQVKEVEAESVAYVVAAAHGMATDGYTFPYVAGWAGADGAKVVLASQDRVARASRALIALSPASHWPGGHVPGADVALAASRHHQVEGSQGLSPAAAESVEMA